MAHFHDDYDSRLQAIRRDTTRLDDACYRSSQATTTTKATTYDRSSNRADALRSHSTSRGQYGPGRSYSPPPPPGDRGYSARHTYPPPLSSARQAWPPRPKCEDEATSLSREVGWRMLPVSVFKDEARSRGTIDQEPIMQDVSSESRPQHASSSSHATAPNKKNGLPTPPTSEDEQSRTARRRPSKLNMNFKDLKEDVPELSQRSASPYAFSSSTGQEPAEARFLSPESIFAPPLTDSRIRERPAGGTRSHPGSPRRDSIVSNSSAKSAVDYFSLSDVDNAPGPAHKHRMHEASKSQNPRPATFPSTPATGSGAPRATAVQDFASRPDLSSVRRADLDSRRNTDTASTFPTIPKLRNDRNRRSAVLETAGPPGTLDSAWISSSPSVHPSASEVPLPRSRDSFHAGSRPGSRSGSTFLVPSGQATPPRSPRNSFEVAKENSSPASRANSVSGSRPASPSPRTPTDSPRLPPSEHDWSALLHANAARRSKPPSRLQSYASSDSPVNVSRPGDKHSYAASRNSSLPYPQDDGPSTSGASMTSERKHQYLPDLKPNLKVPLGLATAAKTLSRASSPAPRISSESYTNTAKKATRPSRPSLPSSHSTNELPRTARLSTEIPAVDDTKRSIHGTAAQAKKDVQNLSRKSLPSCTRSSPVTGRDDWYTLVGAPSLDFCPRCIESMFERTVFRPSFRRSPPRSFDTPVKCALGGNVWIRRAWLLTLERERTDLRLLKDVAEIDDSYGPCPGEHEHLYPWYGIQDLDGYLVRNFRVCSYDVRVIECLLPSLKDLFVRLPARESYTQAACAMRPDGNRFRAYFDTLLAIHQKATSSRKLADLSPFLNIVHKRQRLQECTKDALITGQLWHFIPTIPSLTVCEDCYAHVVEPEAQKLAPLALQFHRTLQPAYHEGIGSSCALYSRRMRTVFYRALDNNDEKYLARKAKERREKELELQERYHEILKRAQRSSTDSEEVRRCDEVIARISREWKEEWE